MASDIRVVVVTRKTPFDHLLARHGTKGQAEFFLKGQAQSIEPFEGIAQAQAEAVAVALADIPPQVRRTHIDRDELDRFVFGPDDVILAVGQDGLVANVAKYLDGQPVVGVNPNPSQYDGVLCTVAPAHAWAGVRSTLDAAPTGTFERESRSLVEARRADGMVVRALNEVFIGHKTHQSAVYTLTVGGATERQSSSGIIVSTGTGCTGWGRSIAQQRGIAELPSPAEPALAWFVREPFPSVSTGCTLDHGRLEGAATLEVRSELGNGGTVFGDGIEVDNLDFPSGQSVEVRLSARRLSLIRARPRAAAVPRGRR